MIQLFTLSSEAPGFPRRMIWDEDAAVNTISTNLPDMAREVKMLAALMDDRGVEGDDLMTAAKTL